MKRKHVILYIIIFILIMLLLLILNQFIKDNFFLKIFYILFVIHFPLIVGFVTYTIISKIYRKIKLDNINNDYIRNIPNHYSLLEITLLYNNIVDYEQLINSYLIYLYELNLIKIEIKNDKVVVSDSLDNTNRKKFTETSRYIYDWVVSDDKKSYSINSLKKVVQEEAYRNHRLFSNFPHISIKAILFTILYIVYLVAIALITSSEMTRSTALLDSMPLYTVSIISMFIFIMCLISYTNLNNSIYYTKIAKKERYKILGFYKFLKDFTVLNEREVKEYPLWKEYYLYAVLFGINKKMQLKNDMLMYTEDEAIELIDKVIKSNL